MAHFATIKDDWIIDKTKLIWDSFEGSQRQSSINATSIQQNQVVLIKHSVVSLLLFIIIGAFRVQRRLKYI